MVNKGSPIYNLGLTQEQIEKEKEKQRRRKKEKKVMNAFGKGHFK